MAAYDKKGTKDTWVPDKAIGDLNYATKNCLAQNLHSVDRENPQKGCLRGFKRESKLVDVETWASTFETQAGKPAFEGTNRPDIWLSQEHS